MRNDHSRIILIFLVTISRYSLQYFHISLTHEILFSDEDDENEL